MPVIRAVLEGVIAEGDIDNLERLGGTTVLPAVVVDGSGAQPTRLQLDDLEFATELGPDGQGIDKFSRSGPNDS